MNAASPVLTWSADGTSVLLHPADGSYRLLELTTGRDTQAQANPKLAPDCAAQFERLAARAKALAMAGVAFPPGTCQVTVAPRTWAPEPQLEVKQSGGRAIVFHGDTPIVHAAVGSRAGPLRAFASANGRAVLLLAPERAEPVLGAWIGPGALKDLKPAHRAP